MLASCTAALLGLLVGSPTHPQREAGAAIQLCNYRLHWSDEFDDMSIGNWRLEGKRWIAHTPWSGDFGDARFADPGPDGPFAIKDGKLVITARRDEKGKWTSGLIAAADETQDGVGLRYGYFEARMKVSPGPGTWPAFWLYSMQSRSDPRPDLEIDALEFYGHDPKGYYAAWHLFHKPHSDGQKSGNLMRIPIPDGSFSNEFRRIGVDVKHDYTTYYFDRKLVWRHTTPHEHQSRLSPLVNLALGSGYSIDNTPNPSQLEIDYVRIYEPLVNPDQECARGSCKSACVETSTD